MNPNMSTSKSDMVSVSVEDNSSPVPEKVVDRRAKKNGNNFEIEYFVKWEGLPE